MLSPPLSPFPETSTRRIQDTKNIWSREGSEEPEVRQASSDADDIESIDSAGVSPGAEAPTAAPLAKRCSMKTCWDSLKSNPARYLQRERSFLDLYPLRRHSWAPSQSEDLQPFNYRRAGRQRRSALSKRSTFDADDSPVGYRRRVRSVATDSVDETDEEVDFTPRKAAKKRSTGGSSPVRVHDMNLSQIDDFSPPISTLPPGKSLRAEWKGHPMDLSNDPDAQLLHPAELHLASVLRLPVDVYIDSKRRLFAEKVHRLRQGLPFRRTDSQKACRIDVNKASRLFGAFEKVGWLEDELFKEHLK